MTVPRILNAYIAPFLMGFSMAAFATSGEPVSSVLLLVIAGAAGYFSLPKSDVVIERIWEAVA